MFPFYPSPLLPRHALLWFFYCYNNRPLHCSSIALCYSVFHLAKYIFSSQISFLHLTNHHIPFCALHILNKQLLIFFKPTSFSVIFLCYHPQSIYLLFTCDFRSPTKICTFHSVIHICCASFQHTLVFTFFFIKQRFSLIDRNAEGYYRYSFYI